MGGLLGGHGLDGGHGYCLHGIAERLPALGVGCVHGAGPRGPSGPQKGPQVCMPEALTEVKREFMFKIVLKSL